MDSKSSPLAKKSIADSPQNPKDESDPHFLGHRQRLKERFSKGQGLADYEFLELLLFQAIPRADTKPLAKNLLHEYKSLLGVISAPESSLKKVKGVGGSVIHLFKLLHTLMNRSLQESIQGKNALESWQQVLDYCTLTLSHEQTEHLRVLYLDQKNCIIVDELQQTGTVNHTPIYPREIMKRALEVGATSLILVHNHPSGDPTPSKADIDLTLKVNQIARDLGLSLHDHIIIGKGKHSSLKNMGFI